jgi:LysM repeat protein
MRPRQRPWASASPAPTPLPTVAASAGSSSPAASADPLAGLRKAEYEVQEGEALLAIAERFGVTRRQILLANPGMAESKPYTEPGQVIIVPVSPEVSELLLAASPPPGFVGFMGFLE